MAGQKLETLVDARENQGSHSVQWTVKHTVSTKYRPEFLFAK